MSTSFFTFPSAETNSVAGITRCIRRICVLREQGNLAEATRLEQNEFTNTLRDIRLAQGPDALPESDLRALFAAEEKRVADAVVLSELLIPELVKSFPPMSASPFPSSRPPASTQAPETASAAPFSRPAAPAGVSPIIADLLDAMLASERPSRRPQSSTQ